MCHSGLKTKFNIQIPFAQSRHFELVLTFPTENRLTLRMLTSKLPLINLFVLRLSTDATSSGPIEQVINFNRTGTAGQTVTLQCTSTSSEPADWWFHNETLHQICSVGLIINSFKTDGRFQLQKAFGGDWSLVVRNVRPSDSGVYICRTIEYVVVQYNLTVLRESFFVLVYTTQPLLLLLHVLTTTTITTTTTTTTQCLKNAPTLTSCSFDKCGIGLILIILGLSSIGTLSKIYAYSTFLVPSPLLYWLLNRCNGNDANQQLQAAPH